MIGPVSGTGRAMMASLQQAIQKGMPPDQAIQYVKSMAVQGVAPLTDLYAMMNQFQRLKQQPAQAPQTPPTIKDELNMLDQQQRMQQGNIQQMQAPAPGGVPMDRGLGAIDAGKMEYPQFAGGGIVAFSEGGFNVSDVYERGRPAGSSQFDPNALSRFSQEGNPEELARMYALALSRNDFDTASRLEPALRSKGISQDYLNYIRKNTAVGLADIRKSEKEGKVQDILRGPQPVTDTAPVVTPPAAPPAPPRKLVGFGAAAPSAEFAKEDTTEAEYSKLQAFRKREGIGGAREEMRQFLTDEEKRLDKLHGEDRRLAFADVGFKMAAAASRPGATFLGALAEGAMSGTQAMRAINKELNDNKRLLKQSMIKLKEAEELEKEGDYKAAMGLNKEARAEALKLYEIRESLKIDREKIAAQRESTAASREATQFAQAESRDIKRLQLIDSRLRNNNEYQTLGMQAAAAGNDLEKLAPIQARMNQIEIETERKVGLSNSDPTADAFAELQRIASSRGLSLVPNR
jgi:hypothetical protein